MPSVFIKTYGCQMNERDSEAVAAQLVAKGYSLAKSEAAADVVLLNTCSVRDFAEQKAINKMQNIVGTARSEKRDQIVGFMGCMAQSRGKELLDQLPDVDLVLGTQKFHRAAEYLDELLAGKRTKIVDTAAEAKSEAAIREHLLNGSAKTSVSAFVSIMQGCNQHCTFCIVPATRGEERSRTIPDIVTECRELAARGVREVTLLGQNVNAYSGRFADPEAVDHADLVDPGAVGLDFASALELFEGAEAAGLERAQMRKKVLLVGEISAVEVVDVEDVDLVDAEPLHAVLIRAPDAVVAVVVGHIDCARVACGVRGDMDVELVVLGRVALCCQRSGE